MTIITVLFAIALGSEIQVPAKTSGVVAQVLVEEGETVRRGQPLATLETDYLLDVLREAEATVERMRAIEGDAELEMQRNPKARQKYEIAVAAREEAWFAAAKIRRRFFDSIIRAPQKGIVQIRKVEAGSEMREGEIAFVITEK